MTIAAYILSGTIALTLHFILARGRIGILSPSSLFGITTLVILVSTALVADMDSPTSVKYLNIVAYSAVAYNISASIAVASLKFRAFGSKNPSVSVSPLGRIYWFVVIISAAIVILYYQAVGYSAFVEGIKAAVTGEDADVATLRLESYAGSRYLFPGYVNQFKNALLPILVLVGILSARTMGARIALMAAAGVALFGLIGTGQRGAFFVACLVAAVFTLHWNRSNPISKLGVGIALTLGTTVLTITTLALGRGEVSSSGETRILAALTDIVDRIFLVNARAGLLAFQHTETLQLDFPGQDWITSLFGVLPGNTGSSISGEVFEIAYGSTRGTIPPSIWGSIHFNFGVIGTLAAPIIIAVIFSLISRQIYSSPERDSIELAGISGATVVLGIWMTETPLFLLNSGLFAFVCLWIWGRQRRIASRRDMDKALLFTNRSSSTC